MEPTTIDELLRRNAERAPDAVALADAPNRAAFFSGEPVRRTWAELDASVDALAGDLVRLGAGPDAPVAVQLPNAIELVTTLLACWRIGATAVPFPIQYRSHELTHGLAVSRPSVFVTGARSDRPDAVDETAAVIAAHADPVVLAAFGEEPENESWVERLALRLDGERVDGTASGDAVATVCWTSGTTGTPKGVPRTNAMWLAIGRFQAVQLGFSGDEQILCPFPIVNMAGIGGMLVPWLLSGGTFHLHQPLDLPVFLQQVAVEQITYTVAPPPLLNMLLANTPLLDSVDMSSLRRIGSGSAPLDPSMVVGWQQRDVEIVNIFGSNEGAAMLSTQAVVPDPEQRARFFPRPDLEATGIDARLVDLSTDEEITVPGAVGELRFAGPTVFGGYLESDGSEFDDDGYFRTGDLFEWVDDETTLMRFVDRAKDIIIRGGMNISAAEVEGLLSSHPAIAECAAVGYPDADLGERLGVFVVAAPDTDPTLDAAIEHLRGLGVASYKLPERLDIVDALPRNPVGKVTKPELRSRWAE